MSKNALHHLVLDLKDTPREEASREHYERVIQRIIALGIAIMRADSACYFIAHRSIDIRAAAEALSPRERAALFIFCPHGELMAPASQEQARNLYHSEAMGQSVWNIQHVYECSIPGPDLPTLNKALATVAQRQDVLKTHFLLLGEQWIQVVAHGQELDVEPVEAATLAQFQHMIAEERSTLLPVDRAPLFRCRTSREIEGKWYLGFVAHHSLADAFSTTLLFTQLMSCYRSLLDGQPPQLPAVGEQYWQYALKQFDKSVYQNAGTLRYWQQALSGNGLAMRLPYACAPGSVSAAQMRIAASHAVTLPARLSENIERFHADHAITHTQLFTAAIGLLLVQGMGNSRAVIQSLHNQRDSAALLNTVGELSNVLFTPYDIEKQIPVIELLRAIKKQSLQALRYAKVDFSRLLTLSGLHNFQTYYGCRGEVMIDSADLDAGVQTGAAEYGRSLFAEGLLQPELSGVGAEGQAVATLFYQLLKTGRRILLVCSYRKHLFDAEEMHQLSALLIDVVERMLTDPERQVERLLGEIKESFDRLRAQTDRYRLPGSAGGRRTRMYECRGRQDAGSGPPAKGRQTAIPFFTECQLVNKVNEEPSAVIGREPSAVIGREPSAVIGREPSAVINSRPVFWVHGAFGDASVYIGLARQIQRSFYGIQARGLYDNKEPLIGVKAIAAFYREMIQAIQPQGPYDLGGYSIGGTFVYEVARQLQEAGEDVASLTLVDALYPNHHSRLGGDLYEHIHFVAMGLTGMVYRKDSAKSAAVLEKLERPHRSDDRDYLLGAFADLCRDAGVDKSRNWIVDYLDRMVSIQRGYRIEDYQPEPLPHPIAHCHYFKNQSGLFFGNRLAHLNVAQTDPLSGVDYWSEWRSRLPNLEFTPIEVDNHIEMLEDENSQKVIGDYCRALYQGVPPVAPVNESVLERGVETDYKARAVRYLTELFAHTLERPTREIQPHQSLEHYGLDSFAASTLTTQLQAALGSLSITVFYECRTLAALADYLLANHGNRFQGVLDMVAPDPLCSPCSLWLENKNQEYYGEHGEHRESKRKDHHREHREHGDKSAWIDDLHSRRLPAGVKYKDVLHENRKQVEGIAIIGLSGRYPKARNIADYWQLLRDGVDCIDTIPQERWNWRDYYSEDRTQAGAQYSKWGGFIEDIDKFDALFFNISPREAEFLDPQERLFLEQAWTAVEDAGYRREDLQGEGSAPVSVYVGVMYGEYQFLGIESSVNGNRRALGGSYASIANRVSYVFDLHGPSMSLDSACSSSLTCIHMACQDLRTGVSNLAIAGGVNLSLHPNKYLMLSAGQFISSKGHCESFGEGGDGFIPAEGVGVAVLKRLCDAERDGDHIYGVIKSSAVNHGGKTNGYTVPNPIAQQQVVQQAIEAAGIDPRQINYIEAHGTGTRIGDPIEIAGLTKAFRESGVENSVKPHQCWIGSAKSNLGHCEAAAGIAGLSKVLLQMQHGQIVPSLHSSTLNAHIDFSATPFIVNQELRDWERPVIDGKTRPRAAGISSFGAGGSNAHIIVEEYIPESTPQSVGKEAPALIVLSARNPERLREMAGNLCSFLNENRDNATVTLRDLAYTLQVGREAMSERLGMIVQGMEELRKKLEAFVNGEKAEEGVYCGRLLADRHGWRKCRECRSIFPADRDPLHFFAGDDELQAALSQWVERKKFAKLLELWVQGLSFDWRRLYPHSKPRRISLPTYPFARERHWIDQTSTGHNSEIEAPFKRNRQSSGLLMATPVWVDKPVAEQSQALKNARHIVILCGFTDKTDFALVPEDVSRFHLHTTGKNVAAGFLELAGQLFSIIRDLIREAPVPQALLQVLVPAQGENRLYAALSGMLQTTHREQPGIRTQLIQMDSLQDPQLLWTKLRENKHSPEDIHIRYYQDKRQVLSWKALPEAGPVVSPPWRNGGNYLITGGAGGLGLIFSREIAQKAHGVFLLLVGRSELNAGQQAAIRQIENLGAEVEYRRADIGELEQARELIEYLRQRGKPLNGIIHTAGIIRDNFIQKKSVEEFRAVIAPKVMGTVHLDLASRGLDLDFFILFSSAAGVFGNAGQADYATANAFMDAYAHYRNTVVEARGRTYSVNWPLWAEGGMGVDRATEQAIEASFGMVPMATDKGVRALEWMLTHSEPRLLVIEGDVEKIKRQLPGRPAAGVTTKPEVSSPLDNQQLQTLTLSRLQALFGKVIKLPDDQVDPAEPFEHYGIDSVMITQLNRELGVVFGEISKTLFFECKRLSEVAAYLAEQFPDACATWCGGETVGFLKPDVRREEQSRIESVVASDIRRQTSDPSSDPIAIIGLSGHYPEAATLEDFWENLRQGKDCIREIPEDRWPMQNFYEPDIDKAISSGKSYCKWGSFLETFAQFDPLFFNISPREAQCMDPQERQLLQCAWEVLEDAGYTRASLVDLFQGRVGVFAGVTSTGFDLHGPALWRRGKNLVPRTSFSSIANRISYFLDLNGPSIAIDTMCSSSLTALHEACEKIRRGECDLAIAGAVNLYSHPVSYQNLSANRMLSVEGRCKSFARGGDGFVPGEGVGAVLLKPLSRARADGDNIYGLVRGTHVNHGGKTNGYTVPNPRAQADLISEALHKAKVHPRAVSYFEAHGTGTELGDPIEITGMTQAFRKQTSERGYCALGSIKSNIGHLEAAAGMAGLTKILLQMKHKQIVPSLHARDTNPNIDFDNTPFVVQQKLADWQRPVVDIEGEKREFPRIACISSFGAGGANAHAIIEECEDIEIQTPRQEKTRVILLSAKHEDRLKAMAGNLLRFISAQEQHLSLIDIAYTLHVGREAMDKRLGILADSLGQLREKLQAFLDGKPAPEGVCRNEVKRNREQLAALTAEEKSVQSVRAWIAAGDYEKLLDYWTRGYNIDWHLLYEQERPKRVSLPVYPFAGERYWFELEEEVGRRTSDQYVSWDGFSYLPRWERQPAVATAQETIPPKTILVVCTEMNTELRDALVEDCKFTWPAAEIITPATTEDLCPDNADIGRVYFMASGYGDIVTPEQLAGSRQRNELQLLRLLKQLARRIESGDAAAGAIDFYLLTFDRCPAGAQAINPQGSGLAGLACSIAQAEHRIRVRSIDLSLEEFRQPAARGGLLRQVHGEAPSARGETVRLEGGMRYTQAFRKFAWNSFNTQKPLRALDQASGFESDGVYLILGGSGVVGGLVTHNLIRKYRARVAWIGRTPADSPAIQESLNKYGDRLHYTQADALDLAALEKGIAEIKASLGRIDGALFAGKVFTLENPLVRTSEREFNDIVDIKTQGVLNLYLALRREPLKFLCYFSSVQAFSFLPAKESVGYAAGITAADALVASLRDRAVFPIGVINWGYWQASVAGTEVEQGLARHFRFIGDEFGFRFIEKFLSALRGGALDRVMCLGVQESANALINCPSDELVSISAAASSGSPEGGLDKLISSLQVKELERENETAPVWNLPTRQQRDTLENWTARLLHAQLTRCRNEKILAKYQRWLLESSTVLNREIRAIEQPVGSFEELWPRWLEYCESLQHPESSTVINKELRAAANLVDICLTALPDILSGRKTAQDVLFPGGSIEKVEALYRGNALSDFFNTQLGRIVEAFVNSRNGAVRLLEIGAGTGSTTAIVLQQLLPHLERIEDYCYTDLSEAFLGHAKKCYESWFPKMSYKRLDIQQPLEAQGIAAGTYDIVIATNVLHATRNIRQTIRHAKSALKRNGIILINEVVEKSIVGTVTFGLLDGWWLYEDEDLRIPGSPLLDLESWRRLLEEEGFHSVTAATGAAEALGQDVIVGESDGCVWLEQKNQEPQIDTDKHKYKELTTGQLKSAINDVKTVVLNALVETIDGIGAAIESDEPFADYGVDSILGVSFVNRLNRELGLELNATVLFEYTTVDQLSNYIVGLQSPTNLPIGTFSSPLPLAGERVTERENTIAIIGYSGRFPGASDIEAFWQKLMDGQGVVGKRTVESSSTPWGELLEDRDCFDPLFFNISPLEAESMNRHQRLLLQEGWKALEDAGCNPKSLKENPVGVFVGAEPVGAVQASFTGASDALIASRLSYFLGLRGPAMVVNTGCSSSGTALHLACQSLRNGESDIALAAGAHVSMEAEMMQVLAETGILSRSGTCRTFDDAADGTVLSEGLGVVVLKRLADAVADGHSIHGVIIASGLNQDGASNGITAPSGTAQEALILDVYQRFGIDPEHITYIEAHGTGTKLGDPVEANALTRAFRQLTDKRHYCAVGSAKAHIGHTSASSAVIGLIKILLSMRNRKLPGLPNFTKLNHRIEFEQSPFYINTTLREWQQAGPLTAALSSFGHSGTNAHFVIREYLEEGDSIQAVIAPQPQVIVLSARTRQQLKENAGNLHNFVKKNPSIELRDLAFTLQVGRDAMEERIAFVATNTTELMEKLALFVNDDDLVAEKNETAEAWLQGRDIDWQSLHDSPRPRLIRLPTYSFARELFQFPTNSPTGTFSSPLPLAGRSGARQSMLCPAERPERLRSGRGAEPGLGERVNPLAQRNTSTREGFRFTSRFTGEEFYLADHRVDGSPTMPGVVYLEMVRAAVERLWGTSPQRLRDIVWLRPIIVVEDSIDIHIGLRQNAESHIEYDIYSEHPAEGRQVHCSGRAIVFDAPACSEPMDIEDLEERFAALGDKGPSLADCREAFSSMGVHYGPGFQSIEALRADADQVLAKLNLPAVVQQEDDNFLLHPSQMDSALQAAMGLTLASDIETSSPRLPFALEYVDILAPCTANMWVWIRRSVDSIPGNQDKLDIDLFNEAGQASVRIRGLCSRILQREQANSEITPVEKTESNPSAISLLTPIWRKVHTPAENLIQPQAGERVLVVGGSEAQRRAIREIFPAARQLLFNPSANGGKVTIALSRPVDHLIWIAPESEVDDPADEGLIDAQQQGVLHLFQLIKAMLAADYGLEDLCWTLITTQARSVNSEGRVFPAHAGVHGLAGSMAKEFPHWKIRLLDMEGGGKWLCSEMFSLPFNQQGDALFYRSGEWFAEELAPVESVPAAPGLYKQHGVYVVIGGAGGVGEVWSEWVIEKFQAQVIWLGRRALDSGIQASIDRLSNLRPAPVYIQADATDAAALKWAFGQIKREHARIDGVVHSAIVLLDKGLMNMSAQDFEAGLRAKVDICVRLAQVCQGEALDFVLFFSSLQSFTKAPGQSNYAAGCTFADSFSRLLERRWPCPVKVINWGYWGEVGIVSDAGYQERMARAGLVSINREEGMEGLETLLAGPFDQLALVKIGRTEQQLSQVPAESQISPSGEWERVMAYPTRIPAGIEIFEGEMSC